MQRLNEGRGRGGEKGDRGCEGREDREGVGLGCPGWLRMGDVVGFIGKVFGFLGVGSLYFYIRRSTYIFHC